MGDATALDDAGDVYHHRPRHRYAVIISAFRPPSKASPMGRRHCPRRARRCDQGRWGRPSRVGSGVGGRAATRAAASVAPDRGGGASAVAALGGSTPSSGGGATAVSALAARMAPQGARFTRSPYGRCVSGLPMARLPHRRLSYGASSSGSAVLNACGHGHSEVRAASRA